MPQDTKSPSGTQSSRQKPGQKYRVIYKDTADGKEKCTQSVVTMKAAGILLEATEGPDVHAAWIEECRIIS